MKSGTRSSASAAGFTLVEMLVATAVLALLVIMVNQLTSSATVTTNNSRKHMDSDSQARMIFDRMASDFEGMFKRPDVDCIFYKNFPSSSGSPGTNDALFFYSESPGYFDNPPASAAQQSSVSLVGYRINTQNSYYPNVPVLERLGKGLTWDGANNGSSSGSLIFFATLPGSATPATTTLLDGNWPTIGSSQGAYADGTDSDYHVLSEQAYRMEIAFLLNDGTISTFPVTNPGGTKNNLGASGAPLPGNDNTQGYTVGSRWFDTSATGGSRGYICTNSATGVAVWDPIGIRDVSAVIVAIAVLDTNSRKLITNASNMVGALRDPINTDFTASPPQSPASPPQLMAQTWSAAVNSSDFVANSGIPRAAASQVRIYQRYFYINNVSE